YQQRIFFRFVEDIVLCEYPAVYAVSVFLVFHAAHYACVAAVIGLLPPVGLGGGKFLSAIARRGGFFIGARRQSYQHCSRDNKRKHNGNKPFKRRGTELLCHKTSLAKILLLLLTLRDYSDRLEIIVYERHYIQVIGVRKIVRRTV